MKSKVSAQFHNFPFEIYCNTVLLGHCIIYQFCKLNNKIIISLG